MSTKIPSQIKCHACDVNDAEFSLKNGDEILPYCEPDFADTVVDLIRNNVHISFTFVRVLNGVTYINIDA